MSLNKSKALRTAEKYVLQGKISAAIDEYRKVVDADPTDLTTINTLGDLYVRAGRIQDAIANFSRIAESYRESGFTLKAIAMLKKISKLDPTNIETAMKLANLYSQQGLLVEARQQYLQVADAYARSGQTRKALEAYQKIADLDPSNTAVRMKLGEIYSREGMIEQAHESFIMAGAEFLRKGDTEQALSANLKAIAINSESRQGLTAIASIYTQQGQADRAINVLCDAFEKNPGDVELLTILGRTYMSAGLMDDAERTFLSLVELDRNRYHYLLEVGRRFLQMGDLDRAAEQIDGCLEVLIAKREEDKAIDFLRRVLDRDLNHVGALKRLAGIFLRIREDHNLIATLNSLAEAAMRKGDDAEAIAALKELARLEPDEPMHLQRLYNLGVRDITEPGEPDVVRATGPLDYESAAFDDAFVIRQISEAEILAGHGQVDHAVLMLKEILNHAPENVQLHLKLKDIYLRAGIMDKAALQCLELARIHEARGEQARASDFMAEAHQLNPLIESLRREPANQSQPGWVEGVAGPFGYDTGFASTLAEQPGGSYGGFEVRDDPNGFDLARYQTGVLEGQAGFVTVPGEQPGAAGDQPAAARPPLPSGHAFNYDDVLSQETVEPKMGSLSTDASNGSLVEELEGIDFYIAQGYFEIAQDTLVRLLEEYGHRPEIIARCKELGMAIEPALSTGAPDAVPATLDATDARVEIASFDFQPEDLVEEESVSEVQIAQEVYAEEIAAPPASNGDLTLTVPRTPEEGERPNFLPFLVQKESGPLDPDLIVKFNTSELLNDTAFDVARTETGSLPLPSQARMGTADLLETIASNLDSSFDVSQVQSLLEAEPVSIADPPPPVETAGSTVAVEEEAAPAPEAEESVSGVQAEAIPPLEMQAEFASTNADLQQIFEEVSGNTGNLTPLLDYETHYSLGLAYKDMELFDEAIEQFQMAFKVAGAEDVGGNHIQCCHMLGVCFNRKQMPRVAVMWFERGLKVPGRNEDEYQALRFEIGQCYEEEGEFERAIDAYMEVYGIDVNYRQVGERIKRLQALKSA
ncbi:MAG TPA: tetratricopeptide repeat protein [Blastocatellia bacterium]|nr:tetratricopeptide repeat protein [Blastocatellia bacterium]